MTALPWRNRGRTSVLDVRNEPRTAFRILATVSALDLHEPIVQIRWPSGYREWRPSDGKRWRIGQTWSDA